jgi:hypothetical protein
VALVVWAWRLAPSGFPHLNVCSVFRPTTRKPAQKRECKVMRQALGVQRRGPFAALLDVDHMAQVEALHISGARSTAAGIAASAFYDAEEGQARQPASRLSCDL